MNLKAHTQLALKRGDGNSNSKASKQPAQDQYVTSSLRTTSTASSFDWAGSLPLTPQVKEPDSLGSCIGNRHQIDDQQGDWFKSRGRLGCLSIIGA